MPDNAPFLAQVEGNDSNFADLAAVYRERQLVIYTGAGVSRSSSGYFGVGGWEDLLRLAVKKIDPNQTDDFEEVISTFQSKPWHLATCIEKRFGRQRFQDAIAQSVRSAGHFAGRYRQLGGKFLRDAPTLTAVAAFCARINKAKTFTYPRAYQIGRNERIAAILTSNYDCYLEAASASMFRQQRTLKPVAAYGSNAGTISQIPVFHINGYVSLTEDDSHTNKSVKNAFVELVLTSSDYEKAWQYSDIFCPTMGPQIHYLIFYVCLFLGFSFRDEYVNKLLARVREEKKETNERHSYHYSIMNANDYSRLGHDELVKLGVRPIIVKEYSDIPNAMARIYEYGLIGDHLKKILVPTYERKADDTNGAEIAMSAGEYWTDLMSCRNSMVRQRS